MPVRGMIFIECTRFPHESKLNIYCMELMIIRFVYNYFISF